MRDRGTLLELIDRNAEEHPDVLATVDGDYRLTWAQYRERARAIALALLDLGVRPGELVGLHLVNRAEHVLADAGALLAGATTSSYYYTLAPDQLAYVAADSGAVVAVVDAEKLDQWLQIRDRLPALRHLVALDLPADQQPPAGVSRFEELVDKAAAQLADRVGEVVEAGASTTKDDTLTIVYTSGTTGPPKGTVVTHGGARWVMDDVRRQLEESSWESPVGKVALSYLPLAHMAERMFSHYLAIGQVITVHYVRDPKLLPEALPVARPHVFLGVPRIWEKIYGTIAERAAAEPKAARRALGQLAIRVAVSVGRATFGGPAPSPVDRLLHPLLRRLVYRRIVGVIGLDRVEYAVSGAAPLSAEVLAFWSGIGIDIYEAYGMTETTCVLTTNPADAPRPGTVGKALPGVELRIAPDGEILARGPNMTPGYLNNPAATAELIDDDGWLHTGDIGELDADGYLRLTGRKKELIINAAGKNISPANIEQALSGASALLGPVCVYGDGKPYLVALVTLDPLGWREWCTARGIAAETPAEAVADERVRAEVDRAVTEGNAGLSRVEQVKRWTLLDRLWDVPTGELTPTLKLKRPVVTERYRDEIERLYA